MRLVVIPRPGVVEMRETRDLKPRPGMVLIETHYTGISAGTELMVLDGKLPNIARGVVRYPLVPGYENVGRVVASDSGATGFAEGSWVCSEGSPNFQDFQSCWGGHCGHVLVPAKETFSLPVGMTPEDGVFMVLTSIALHGIQRARIGLGETVAIFGQGVVGLLALQLARMAGAERVIAVDKVPFRLDLSMRLGADETLLVADGGKHGIRKACEEIVRLTHGRGADVVLEVTGSADVASESVIACRERGRFLLLGMYATPLHFDCWDLYSRELDILSSRGAGPKDELPFAYEPWTWRRTYEESLRLIASKRVAVQPLITHRLPAERIEDGYRALREQPDQALKVVLQWR